MLVAYYRSLNVLTILRALKYYLDVGWSNEPLLPRGRYRRLSKDYEYLTDTSEAMIYAAMTHLMLRRITRNCNS